MQLKVSKAANQPGVCTFESFIPMISLASETMMNADINSVQQQDF